MFSVFHLQHAAGPHILRRLPDDDLRPEGRLPDCPQLSLPDHRPQVQLQSVRQPGLSSTNARRVELSYYSLQSSDI